MQAGIHFGEETHMKTPAFVLIVIILAAGCFAQTPAAPSNEELTQILPGILIPAELSKSLDAKKAKPGDKIELKTSMDLLSHGQIVIPRNSKIEGHVTSAQPHTKDAPDSELGIAFDRILIKNGKELPIQAVVQAIAPPLIIINDAPGSPAAIGAPPPGQQSGNVGSADAPGTALSSAPQVPSMNAPATASSARGAIVLTSESHGAVGIKGTTVGGTKEANLITSSSQNVHLDGGTQFMLKTE
jgi:hypothetical protein